MKSSTARYSCSPALRGTDPGHTNTNTHKLVHKICVWFTDFTNITAPQTPVLALLAQKPSLRNEYSTRVLAEYTCLFWNYSLQGSRHFQSTLHGFIKVLTGADYSKHAAHHDRYLTTEQVSILHKSTKACSLHASTKHNTTLSHQTKD